MVVKSVQRGSLAEVRRLRGATPAPGLRADRRVGHPPPAQKAREWQWFLLVPCPPGETESRSLGASDRAPGIQVALPAWTTSSPCWPCRGQTQKNKTTKQNRTGPQLIIEKPAAGTRQVCFAAPRWIRSLEEGGQGFSPRASQLLSGVCRWLGERRWPLFPGGSVCFLIAIRKAFGCM